MSILPEEARALDENAEFLGVSRLQLMENAGSGVVCSLKKRMGLKGKRVVVLCHTGNKGGDGFVIARHLSFLGADVAVVLMAKPAQIATPEARSNYSVIERMDSIEKHAAATQADLKPLEGKVKAADIIVDAMLGTGARGPLREPLNSAVELANSSKAFKVAVDVPTGIDPATGESAGIAFRADLTVTHHKPKAGLMKKPKEAGEIETISIGMPPEAEIYTGPGDLRLAFRPKGEYAHKGQGGRLLVIGGSDRYVGAPTLSALAALKLGVDLVTMAVPKSIVGTVRTFSPDLIVVPLPSEDRLDRESVPALKEEMKKATAVVIGMGLGLDPETKEAAREIIRHARTQGVPLVVDADAIKALGEDLTALTETKADAETAAGAAAGAGAETVTGIGTGTVITPHAMEFYNLTKEKLPPEKDDSWKKRLPLVMKWASRLGVTLLVKSRYDIIADGKRYKVKTIGNPGMAVGGTGDVLAGLVGGLMSTGAGAFRAAAGASFLNSYAGDMLAEGVGAHFTAEELAEAVPAALKRLGI